MLVFLFFQVNEIRMLHQKEFQPICIVYSPLLHNSKHQIQIHFARSWSCKPSQTQWYTLKLELNSRIGQIILPQRNLRKGFNPLFCLLPAAQPKAANPDIFFEVVVLGARCSSCTAEKQRGEQPCMFWPQLQPQSLT